MMTTDTRTPPALRLRLDDLLQAAQTQWGVQSTGRRLTPRQVMHGTQVHQRTLEQYLTDQAIGFQFDVLGRLCWYFGVGLDTLLAVAAGDGAPLPPVVLGRAAAPRHLPPVGGIRVLNFLPAEVALHTAQIEAATGWTQQAVDVLLSGGQQRVYRRTLATLLPVLGSTRVSHLLQVQCDLDAADPSVTDLAASVVLYEPQPAWLVADWRALARDWRARTGGPEPGRVTATDIAVVRYVAAAQPEQMAQPTSRVANLLAAALGVTRALVRQIARGELAPEIGATAVPEAVRRVLEPLVARDWRTTAVVQRVSG